MYTAEGYKPITITQTWIAPFIYLQFSNDDRGKVFTLQIEKTFGTTAVYSATAEGRGTSIYLYRSLVGEIRPGQSLDLTTSEPPAARVKWYDKTLSWAIEPGDYLVLFGLADYTLSRVISLTYSISVSP